MNALFAVAAAFFAEAFYFLAMRPIEDLPLGVICIAAGSGVVSMSGRIVQWRMKRQLEEMRLAAQKNLQEIFDAQRRGE